MVAPVEALVAMPEGLGAAEAAPLLCAGITMYNSLRHSGAMPGDLVAVQGIGGNGSHDAHFFLTYVNQISNHTALESSLARSEL